MLLIELITPDERDEPEALFCSKPSPCRSRHIRFDSRDFRVIEALERQ